MSNLKTYTEDEKRKAAYALNLCTVSVSQIVDYNDVYVLEQEYDAILNNLNLEAMPKDEALLNILVEMLNTITFFRIQDLKKQKIEKDYQRRVKNAVWSAVPNFGILTVGNPIVTALSVATQVGTAYMNYRREKVNAGVAKTNSEFELQITAMEQFNALKRELFTTAWRLADAYGFNDEWRLTENQIEQYNQILMDGDEYRKYARLEAIAPNFEAYPPFWYIYAHTALYISENETGRTKTEYLERAKSHFEKYYQLNCYSLLREDKLAASALLEYSDLLLLENTKGNKGKIKEKVYELIQKAQKQAGNANDVLQLCAISYLKIGKTEDTAKLLKYLVNEEYNLAMNARLLSRIYVSQYVETESATAYAEYKILAKRVVPEFIFPLPTKPCSNKALEETFVKNQKVALMKAYRTALQNYAQKSRQSYEETQRDLERPGQSSDNNTLLFARLATGKYSRGCVDQLNQMVAGLDTLQAFQTLENRKEVIKLIEANLRNTRAAVQKLQTTTAAKLSQADYNKLANLFSFQTLTESFFDNLKSNITNKISKSQDLGDLNQLEDDLLLFCSAQKLPEPRYLNTSKADASLPEEQETLYFNDVLLDSEPDPAKQEALIQKMKATVRAAKDQIIKDPESAAIYLATETEFDIYFANQKLTGATKYLTQQKAAAILDDKTNRDYDLILTTDGIVIVDQNRILDATIPYGAVKISSEGGNDRLETSNQDICDNAAIDLKALYTLLQEIDKLA